MLSWLKRNGARYELWAESPSLGVVLRLGEGSGGLGRIRLGGEDGSGKGGGGDGCGDDDWGGSSGGGDGDP